MTAHLIKSGYFRNHWIWMTVCTLEHPPTPVYYYNNIMVLRENRFYPPHENAAKKKKQRQLILMGKVEFLASLSSSWTANEFWFPQEKQVVFGIPTWLIIPGQIV